MIYPDHVTRYNHRDLGYLDAPRTYSPRSGWDIASTVAIILAGAVLITLAVMILGAM